MALEIRMDDIVKLRKPHPCGSDEWRVVRLGADIGLTCQGCGRRIMLARSVLQRRMKGFVSRGAPLPNTPWTPSQEKEGGT